jgi:hypothetical protein
MMENGEAEAGAGAEVENGTAGETPFCPGICSLILSVLVEPGSNPGLEPEPAGSLL